MGSRHRPHVKWVVLAIKPVWMPSITEGGSEAFGSEDFRGIAVSFGVPKEWYFWSSTGDDRLEVLRRA